MSTATMATQPDFWLHDAHVRMRESVTALVAEAERIGPANNGKLPTIAHDMLHVLDELTKMTQQGYSMQPPRPPIAGPADATDNDPMEARVAKLEDFAVDARERLTRIETKLDGFATKADLADAKSDLVKWIVGTAIGLAVAGITVMTFVLNNAIPKGPPLAAAAQPHAIIINVPGPAPTASAPK